MARYSRQRYKKIVVASDDAMTTSRDQNVAGLSSAITLCTELLTDYAAHVADAGDEGEEHKALHTAGQLASAVAPLNLAQLLARTNDLTAKYVLHNTDAVADAPEFHQAKGTASALAASTAVTTLSEAIARLNDIKTKFNAHDADAVAHTAGSKHQIAAAASALGVEILVTEEDVKLGDKVVWGILNGGTGSVTGVSAIAQDGGIVFKFSNDPQDDAIISYAAISGGL